MTKYITLTNPNACYSTLIQTSSGPRWNWVHVVGNCKHRKG